jgi:DNA-directed RNA polymerase subunit M/transcription elongation factor TFIIS
MADIPYIRKGVKELIHRELRKEVTGEELAAKARDLAEGLEEGLWEQSGRLGSESRKAYARKYTALIGQLQQPYGTFLESTLAGYLLGEKLSIADALEPRNADEVAVMAHLPLTDERLRASALLYKLVRGDQRLGDAAAQEVAKGLEKGAYNAAVQRCCESEDSYLRQWDSEMFLSIYSARVGLLAASLDPEGSVAKAFPGAPARILGWLLEGQRTAEEVGQMAEADLCPDAGAAEQALVNQRLQQKVAERVSALYRCPRCRARSCTLRTVQIGAGDEPSSIMCSCTVCGENFEGH